jgi:ATP-dependent protease HslVU (ClpYQ) peptidase subunit
MTCIVGVEHAGGVVIGGDSMGISGWRKTTREDPKVFTVGPYLIGSTGSLRSGQLLRYRLEVGAPDDPHDIDRFVATTFMEAVRKVFIDGGFETKTDEGQAEGGSFLLGVAGRLYDIQTDYQYARSVTGYLAIGCGDEFALGSLYETGRQGCPPRVRVESALKASAAHCAAVAPPFTIIEQEWG